MARGNANRCKVCGKLAGIDGYCKRHRPKKRTDFFRDDPKKPGYGYSPSTDNYGILSDFGVKRRGYEN